MHVFHPPQNFERPPFGMVGATGLKNMPSSSPSVASSAYQLYENPPVGSNLIKGDT
jgi:hypothetical protein